MVTRPPSAKRSTSGGINRVAQCPCRGTSLYRTQCSLRCLKPCSMRGLLGVHGSVQIHGSETLKLPLSAIAPASEYGGTAHAFLRRVPHDHEHGTHTHGSWVLHPAGDVACGWSPDGGMHLEHTPGYGETPPCSAFEAANDPPRGPLAAPFPAHCGEGCLCSLHRAMPSTFRE